MSALLSLTKPFTPNTLKSIRSALIRVSDSSRIPISPKTHVNERGNAAVLIPFCNIDNVPGILLEVRGKALRMHSGEVSFPGGRVDNTDASFLAAALRETQEELGVDPRRVEVLGEIGPPELSLGKLRVWPYIGFIHQKAHQNHESPDSPLPSLDLTALRKETSQAEVASVFHLPLAALTSPTRMRSSMFRGSSPYWTVDVSDLVQSIEGGKISEVQQGSAPEIVYPGASGGEIILDNVGNGEERLEVWGLTGWYLSLLMRTLHIYQ